MTKYLGPKTDAASLAAQGDLPIAVSSTPPAGASEGDLWLDSDTGRLYCYYDAQWINPASVGRSVSTAAATTITGTNSEGTSNSLARADHNHAFGSKSVPASALALGPTYETSLPGSPVDGQEIYYAADATNGVIWHLRYRSGSSSSYKWEFVGGASMSTHPSPATQIGPVSLTANTWGDISTAINITAPLEGDYLVAASSSVINTATAGVFYLGIKRGATEEVLFTISDHPADKWNQLSVFGLVTGVGAGGASKVIGLRFKNNFGGTNVIYRLGASLEITPIRVI